MIFVASELISNFLNYSSNVFFWEFCIANLNTLSTIERIVRTTLCGMTPAKHIHLKRNCSPSSSFSRGVISKIPLNENGWPPKRKQREKDKFSFSSSYDSSSTLTVSKLCVKDFDSRMVDADTEIRGVFIQPVLNIKEQNFIDVYKQTQKITWTMRKHWTYGSSSCLPYHRCWERLALCGSCCSITFHSHFQNLLEQDRGNWGTRDL